jgi:5-methylthioadenosine/S-adenosylhomocysteine deaminase
VLMADGEVTVADADAIRAEAQEVAESLDLEEARKNARELKP